MPPPVPGSSAPSAPSAPPSGPPAPTSAAKKTSGGGGGSLQERLAARAAAAEAVDPETAAMMKALDDQYIAEKEKKAATLAAARKPVASQPAPVPSAPTSAPLPPPVGGGVRLPPPMPGNGTGGPPPPPPSSSTTSSYGTTPSAPPPPAATPKAPAAPYGSSDFRPSAAGRSGAAGRSAAGEDRGAPRTKGGAAPGKTLQEQLAARAAAAEYVDEETQAYLKALEEASGPIVLGKVYVTPEIVTYHEEPLPQTKKEVKVYGGVPAVPWAGPEPENGFKAPKRTVPSSVPMKAIIEDANRAYLLDAYKGLQNYQFLQNADDSQWQQYLCVDWNTILSDPAFVEKYGSCSKVMDRTPDIHNSQSFEASMHGFVRTLRQPCHSSGTPERNAVAAIERFIITLDMSLPEDPHPTYIWDAPTKTLTTVHNPLTIVDSIEYCSYSFDGRPPSGTYLNSWPALWWTLQGKRGSCPVPMELTMCSQYNVRDRPALGQPRQSSSSSSSSRKTEKAAPKAAKTCGLCKGTGNWGPAQGYKECIRCRGSGVQS